MVLYDDGCPLNSFYVNRERIFTVIMCHVNPHITEVTSQKSGFCVMECTAYYHINKKYQIVTCSQFDDHIIV